MGKTPEERELDLVQSWVSGLSNIYEMADQSGEKLDQIMDAETIARMKGKYRLEKKAAKKWLDSIKESLDEQRKSLEDIDG